MSIIPQGFTSVTPYITMDDVGEAVEFYEKTLGAEVVMSMPSPDGKVFHAEIKVGNARIMMGGTNPSCDSKSAQSLGGSPVSFYVYVEDVEAAFAKAKTGGMVEKEALVDMPWGDRMGTLRDSFGIDWTLAEHVRDVPQAEIEAAMKEMF